MSYCLTILLLMLKYNFVGFSSGFSSKLLAVLFVGFLAWAYHSIQPVKPKIPGTPGGPPVTAPRIKLRDGRHLAYKERGTSKDVAMYKIVYVHGFDNCRHDAVAANSLSQVLDCFPFCFL